jgi:hypothetical protein
LTPHASQAAEHAVVSHALARGFLTREQLAQAKATLAERGAAATLLSTLRERVLDPACLPELTEVYRRALAGPEAPSAEAATVVVPWTADAATVVADPSSAERLRPSSASAEVTPATAPIREALAALQRAQLSAPRFNPSVDLALTKLDRLGEGGMGVVTRVHDPRLGRDAALKALRGRAEPMAVARFEREVRLTASLAHPGVPSVYEAGTDTNGDPFLLMRVVEGDSLKDRIKAAHARGRPATSELRELLGALVSVSDAVAYAHSQGVVHRDLKPGNVMVGAFGDVLVMDWGLARRLDAPAEDDLPATLASQAQLAAGDDELTRAGSLRTCSPSAGS